MDGEDLNLNYQPLKTWTDGQGENTTSVVRAPAAKHSVEVKSLTVAAGQTHTIRLEPVVIDPVDPNAPQYGPVTGARAGDVVSLGLPPIPDGLMVTGFASADDTVVVRIRNLTSSAITIPKGRLTVTAGGGPNAGGVQPPPDDASGPTAEPAPTPV